MPVNTSLRHRLLLAALSGLLIGGLKLADLRLTGGPTLAVPSPGSLAQPPGLNRVLDARLAHAQSSSPEVAPAADPAIDPATGRAWNPPLDPATDPVVHPATDPASGYGVDPGADSGSTESAPPPMSWVPQHVDGPLRAETVGWTYRLRLHMAIDRVRTLEGLPPEAVEMPQADQPITDAQVVGTRVADTPIPDQPIAEKPLADASIFDQPSAEEQSAEKPISGTSIFDDPIAGTSIAGTSITDTSITGTSIADEPIEDKPIADKPTSLSSLLEMGRAFWNEAVAGTLLHAGTGVRDETSGGGTGSGGTAGSGTENHAPSNSGVGIGGSGSAVGSGSSALPPEGVLNVVILGSDQRPGDGSWRTDTIVLVSVDRTTGHVGVLSVPRDLWVTIPGHGQGRINTADFIGHEMGLPDGQLVKDTIAWNLDIPVQRFLRINMLGFVDVVDALGGVDVVVDCPDQDVLRASDMDVATGGTDLQDKRPGLHHLDGRTALAFVRARTNTSDFARSRRQQRLLRAVLAKAHQGDVAAKVVDIWNALAGRLTTDFSLPELLALAVVAAGINESDLHARVLDFTAVHDWQTPDGAQVLRLNPEAAGGALVQDLDPDRAPVPGLRVVLVDATGIPGRAQVAQARLEERRFTPVPVTSPITSALSTLYHAPTSSGVAAAQAVVRALGLSEYKLASNEALPADQRSKGDVYAVLGQDWDPCPGQ